FPAVEPVVEAVAGAGGGNRVAGEECEPADGVAAAVVVAVRHGVAGGGEQGLNFGDIFFAADLAEADDVGALLVYQGDDGVAFLLGFGRAFFAPAIGVAVHGQPVPDVVDDEAGSVGHSRRGRGRAGGWL